MSSNNDFGVEIDQQPADGASPGERWGWGLLRPPPLPALVFGAVYGAIAAWDIVVLIRMAKVFLPKITTEIKSHAPRVGRKD